MHVTSMFALHNLHSKGVDMVGHSGELELFNIAAAQSLVLCSKADHNGSRVLSLYDTGSTF